MMNEREDKVRAQAILITATAVGLNYLRIKRRVAKKNAKRLEHQLEADACLSNYATRMWKMAFDPHVSSDEFWAAYADETKFVDIVLKQPMN